MPAGARPAVVRRMGFEPTQARGLSSPHMPFCYLRIWGVQDTTCDVAVIFGLDFSPGAAGGIRTHDPRIKSPLRFHCATAAYEKAPSE